MVAAVFTRQGRPAAYARYRKDDPASILAVLAGDGEDLRAVVTSLARRGKQEEMIVPVHPASPAARELAAGLTVRPRYQPWPAFMMLPLVSNSPFERFRAEVQAGNRPIARAASPPHYEAAGV